MGDVFLALAPYLALGALVFAGSAVLGMLAARFFSRPTNEPPESGLRKWRVLLWYPLFYMLFGLFALGTAGDPTIWALAVLPVMIAQLVHTGFLAGRTEVSHLLAVALATASGGLGMLSATTSLLLMFFAAK